MSGLREAAQQALEAMELIDKEFKKHGRQHWPEAVKARNAASALRAALAEPDYWRKRCVSCGGALPATGQDDRTGECVCGEPTALNTVHRKDGPCYMTEPVAWIYQNTNTDREYLVWRKSNGGRNWQPLFTAPPQRKPLTDEEIDDLSRTMVKGDKSVNWLCRAIERAHGIGDHP